jgi:hypothetical protein
MTMTRLVLVATVLVLALASNAAAGVNGAIGANWNTPGIVYVTIVSSHSFHGDVQTQCTATAVGATNTNETQALTGWVYNAVAHGYQINTSFDIIAAGSGAHCTISLLDGRKLLDQLQFTSV